MPKRNLILIAAIVAAAACVVVFTHRHPSQAQSNRPDDAHSQPADPLQEQLAQAARIIRQHYLYPVKDDKLARDGIDGMVRGLDEFSRYVPPEKLDEFNSRMNGSYRGVGLKVEIISGQVVVIGPMLGSPADRAGFHTGDRIISIDKQDARLLPLSRIYELLDGGPGGSAHVVFQRGAERRERDLPRIEMELETVVGLFRTGQGRWVYMLDAKEGIAYIRVREFCPKTAEQLEKVLREFRNLRSIVLDLRGNPGGGLPSAVSTANLFLREGLIVKSVDRAGRQELYWARPEKTFSDSIPLAILVNGQTASAAEIVAGSLWAHSRAVLIGERTRGKGCVQSLFPLASGLISLTTSEYLLEGDIRISRRDGIGGIAPDLPVASEQEDDLQALRLRGEVLFQPTPETMPATWPDGGEDLTPSFLSLDEPLSAAIKLLRDPPKYKVLLKKAAHARATMPASAPTTSRADDE
jgi:carboxyl-terminal processing protease